MGLTIQTATNSLVSWFTLTARKSLSWKSLEGLDYWVKFIK